MIEQQLALEREMSLRGIERYNKTQDDAVAQGRGADTTYGKRLIPEYVRILAEAIEGAKVKKKSRGIAAKYAALLNGVDTYEAAFITLRYIFDALITGDTVNNLGINLGRRIEDQLRFAKFEAEHAAYYKKIIQGFKASNTTNYRHKHRVLISVSNEQGMEWVSWTPEERLHLGVKLIALCIESTGLVKKVVQMVSANKSVARIVATEDTLGWIEEHKAHAELLHPETMPCIVPPCDWVSLYDGGYYTPEIRQRVPFVKIKSKAHRKSIADTDFSVPMASVNKLQQTKWKVNTKVHDVIKAAWRQGLRIGMPSSTPLEIPQAPVDKDLKKENMTPEQYNAFMLWKREASKVHTAERERFSQCIQLSRVLQMAEKFRAYPEFYYVYNCDFRGRIYCASPGLSPQGADFSKGLLEFAKPKALGDRGAYWLCVHGANTYGFDKASYDDRVAWVKENEAGVLASAADPLDSTARAFWGGADKPWQFLAFCFEYAQYKEQGNSFKSHLAVALDGSCNGLQNFSAMLRDSIGAQATNLRPAVKPEDIYQRVADVCLSSLTDILNSDEEHATKVLARQWLEFGITRKCSKRPVMTLPYGSTRQSCREYIEDYVLDNIERSPWEGKEIFYASLFLSGVMWNSIGSVVVAAREAMDWLQSMTRAVSKENLPLSWHTPTGFKVYQGTMKYDSHRIRTQLCGDCLLTVSTPNNEIDGRRQALGVSPNFVHSMDAAHLIKTVEAADCIESWAMIHDSYGTYAADTDALHNFIRQAFVGMYSNNDVLQSFNEEVSAALDVSYTEACNIGDMAAINRLEKLVLPSIPASGNFDITEVYSSKYFFG